MLAVFAVAFAALFAPQAHAGVMFGEEDTFNTLQTINVPAALITELGLPAEWAGAKYEPKTESDAVGVAQLLDTARYVVTKVEQETVTVDANHPLAGEALRFACKVMAVRQATSEEITHGHVHGDHGHHH